MRRREDTQTPVPSVPCHNHPDRIGLWTADDGRRVCVACHLARQGAVDDVPDDVPF